MNTENFTGRAEAYTKGRPGYPAEAIKAIVEFAPSDAVFADIGAGTGKFTVALAEQGYSVFAVEPNADMRNQLAITLASFPNVKIIDGTDEATNLPKNSVDIITVAHALHWFNPNAFRTECRRIIKPNGLVVAIYNLMPDVGERHFSKQAVDAFFTSPNVFEFPNPMDYTRDDWLAYVASQDNTPLPTSPQYDEHVAAVNAAFDRDSVNGILRCNRVTKVFIEKIE